MTEHEFPQVKPDDADDVSLALETAAALWKKDNREDALRWLRKAADAAELAGDDMRALTLARAAADLKSAAQATAASAPGVPEPVHVAVSLPVSPSDGAPPQRRASLPPKPTKRALPGIGAPVDAAPDSGSRRPLPPSSVRPGPSTSLPPSPSMTSSASVHPSVRQKSAGPGAPPKPKADPGDQPSGALAATSVVATPVAAVADASMAAARAEDTRRSVPVPDSAGSGVVISAPAKPSTFAVSSKPESPSFPPAPTKPSTSTISAKLEPVSLPQTGSKASTGTSGAKLEAVSASGAPKKPAAAPAALPSDAPRSVSSSVTADEFPKDIEGGFQVAIKQSARDHDLFLVRPLGKGQAPPPGYKIAIVVTSDGSLS